jgi:hypothetical protein
LIVSIYGGYECGEALRFSPYGDLQQKTLLVEGLYERGEARTLNQRLKRTLFEKHSRHPKD